MTFKIGDEIIMTADSGKGKVFEGYEEREYRGNIFLIDRVPRLIVQIEDEKCTHYFNTDGSNDDYPGMSIRPVEEKVEPTPSQWIEGRIPDSMGMDKNIYIQYEDGGLDFLLANQYISCREDREVIRYCVIQLPPPPPAKEVEAFGYLQAVVQLKKGDNSPASEDKYLKSILSYKAFYSQSATAEVLEEYIKQDANPFEENKEMTLDSWIIRYSKSYSHERLLFTSAALDELGVK